MKSVLRFILAPVLLAAASGCHGGVAPVIPKDPTPLAKCSIAKSSDSPLITEWPASEKARLETMLHDGAVVVSYSGCSMRVLEGCRAEGRYIYRRTTLSKDTIDISTSDELYAKIPLGAAGLEAELEATGRLAIHTTVVGQMRLDDGVIVPDTPACRGATHVLGSISIGAFEMVTGGRVRAGAKVELGPAGAGAEHRAGESRIRAAGVAEHCGDGDDEVPHPDCSSPLQVFLEPARRADTTGVARSSTGTTPPHRTSQGALERPPEPPAEKSLEAHFEVAPEEEGTASRWSLMTSEGVVLCKLPCVRRVGDGSGLRLQLDADRKEDIKVIALPEEWDYSPGRRVLVVPQVKGTSPTRHIGPAILTLGGVAGFGVGFGFYQANNNDAAPEGESRCSYEQSGARATACTAGLIGGSASLLVSVAGAIWWLYVGTDESDGELGVTLLDTDEARLTVLSDGLRLSF